MTDRFEYYWRIFFVLRDKIFATIRANPDIVLLNIFRDRMQQEDVLLQQWQGNCLPGDVTCEIPSVTSNFAHIVLCQTFDPPPPQSPHTHIQPYNPHTLHHPTRHVFPFFCGKCNYLLTYFPFSSHGSFSLISLHAPLTPQASSTLPHQTGCVFMYLLRARRSIVTIKCYYFVCSEAFLSESPQWNCASAVIIACTHPSTHSPPPRCLLQFSVLLISPCSCLSTAPPQPHPPFAFRNTSTAGSKTSKN